MLRLERSDAREQRAGRHLGVRTAPHPRISSPVFELQGEAADQGLEPRILAFEVRPGVMGAGRLERFRGVGQKLVAPLIVLALADLLLGAQLTAGPSIPRTRSAPTLNSLLTDGIRHATRSGDLGNVQIVELDSRDEARYLHSSG
jgi:hypothetical protein